MKRPRNWHAVDAHFRRGGPMKDRRTPRGGARNGTREILGDLGEAELKILDQGDLDTRIDAHAERAAKELGIPVEDVTPEQRKWAKELNFLETYGGKR